MMGLYQQNRDLNPAQNEPANSEDSAKENQLRDDLPVPLDDPAPQCEISPSSGTCIDRAGLIERLKRGESPTWVPSRHLESVWSQREQPSAAPIRGPTRSGFDTAPPASLQPSLEITPKRDWSPSDDERKQPDVLALERPRSALHSGDFTENETSPEASASEPAPFASTTEEPGESARSWIPGSRPGDCTKLTFEKRQPLPVRSDEVRSALSSLSYPSPTNFVYKPPTSPLFQSESNDEIELASAMDSMDLSPSLPNHRGHTTMISPSGSCSGPSQGLSQNHILHQERTPPYQAHQPRRSLAISSTSPAGGHTPQTPAMPHTHRPSLSSEISPILHASMVGSYEESILRGRMSTTPSKPLNFLAQIGVLGLGKCVPSLRCPRHVTMSFPAVFYSYASSSHGRTKEDDGPSPYVGQIDLANGIRIPEPAKPSGMSWSGRRTTNETNATNTNDATLSTPSRDVCGPRKPRRRSVSPTPSPEGGYRIPQKGQIQIIIKNQNKTAVKLFLVPYDLAGMEPGTKTFVRQRIYSGCKPPHDGSSSDSDSPADHPILRYLVHLHICCPARGSFYLYNTIRVVWASRVPDGRKRLRNEITLPDPRYSPYKPVRAPRPALSSDISAAASLAPDVTTERESPADGFSPQDTPMEPVSSEDSPAETVVSNKGKSNVSENRDSRAAESSRSTAQGSSNMSSPDHNDGQYNKLNKGDVGYEGNAFSDIINDNPAVAGSLLSQRLRSLGACTEAPNELEEDSKSSPPEPEEL
ncbi:hypothetical protein GGR50DRAFT_646321 [Xylaria sp. CBS 124048]|nr:hypothetical protein GGR50DRAFT_646321 [Xylaria sp. CBS 124048]